VVADLEPWRIVHRHGRLVEREQDMNALILGAPVEAEVLVGADPGIGQIRDDRIGGRLDPRVALEDRRGGS